MIHWIDLAEDREVLYNILIVLGIPHETDKANKDVSE